MEVYDEVCDKNLDEEMSKIFERMFIYATARGFEAYYGFHSKDIAATFCSRYRGRDIEYMDDRIAKTVRKLDKPSNN